MAITIGQLQSFTTVARVGSVTAAAEELWVTQPSVSAALAALSREIGVALFERSGRHLVLTPAGESFARYANDVLGLLAQGAVAAREASGAAARTVRIVAVTPAAEHLVPALIRAFTDARPDVTVELRVGNRQRVFELLRSREADVAIAGRPPSPDRDLVAIRFLRNELVLVTAAGDRLASATCNRVEDLARRTWLVREEGSGTRTASEDLMRAYDLHPKVITLGSNGAIKQAVRLGLGVSLQPLVCVEAELRRGRLATIRLPGSQPERYWFAIRSAEGPVREPVSAFLAFVQRRALPATTRPADVDAAAVRHAVRG